MGKKILVVDDEQAIADLIEVYLAGEGWEVIKCDNGTDAVRCVEEEELSMAILDVMLPDIDGFSICRKIREKHFYPVIMLTAKSEDLDKIMGLTIGADDYITKPFSLAVLRERVMAALRRAERYQSAEDSVTLLKEGPFTADLEKQSFSRGDEEVLLSKTEQKLLITLMRNKNMVLGRETLMEKVWGNDGDFVDENALSVSIKRLRDKLEEDPRNPRYIQTVYGIGYRFQAD